MGDTRNSYSISIKDESVAQKSMHRLALPFHIPQSYELAISRAKKGWVESIIAGCILLASPWWSVPPPSEPWYWLPHTPSLSTSHFYPFIIIIIIIIIIIHSYIVLIEFCTLLGMLTFYSLTRYWGIIMWKKLFILGLLYCRKCQFEVVSF